MRFIRAAAVAGVLGVLAAPRLAAQAASGPPPGGFAVGGSVGALFVLEEPAGAVTATLHVSYVRPGLPGIDLSLGTMPMSAAGGALTLLPTVGVGFPLIAGSATLLPRAGLAGLGGMSGDGGAMNGGAYVGAALLLGRAGGYGLRADLSRIRYLTASETYWSFDLGLTRLPGRAAGAR